MKNQKVKRCNLNMCQAMCCYEGVYLSEGEEESQLVMYEQDPFEIDAAYPGYVSFTDCGKQADDGEEWEKVLSKEIHYFKDKNNR